MKRSVEMPRLESRGSNGVRGASILLVLLCSFCMSAAVARADSLPDNRAYEQVTPTDKNGGNIQARTNYVEAAANGSAITYYISGGMPGGVNATDLPIFMSSRQAGGWKALGLLPPPDTGARGRVAGWSPDLQNAFDVNYRLDATGNAHLYDLNTATTGITSLADHRSFQATFVGSTPDGRISAWEDIFAEIYVINSVTGTVTPVSLKNDGTPVEFPVAGPYNWDLSQSGEFGGSWGEFYTAATNVLSTDGSTIYFSEGFEPNQLYVRRNIFQSQSAVDGNGECTEPLKACTIKVSETQASSPDPNGERGAAFVGASPDGSQSLFLSSGKLTDDATTGPEDEGADLYHFDADTGQLEDLTQDPSDPKGADVVGVLGYGRSMSYVYFAANGVLAPGAAPGNCVRAEASGGEQCNLYVWHEGAITFIGPMQAGSLNEALSGRGDQLNWAPSAKLGVPPPAGQVSPSGTRLLFSSVVDQTNFQSGGMAELYLYSAETGQVSCVSCNAAGVIPRGSAETSSLASAEVGPSKIAAVRIRNLTDEGRRVLFDTSDSLLPGDTNGVSDVYEWEEVGVGSCTSAVQDGGCLYLISTGSSKQASFFADANESGEDAFFFTAQSLVAQDGDELVDIYDSKVGGGLPSQNVVPPSPCADRTACSGQVSPPSSVAPPRSSTLDGQGNVRAKPHHKARHHHKRKRHRKHKGAHKSPKTSKHVEAKKGGN